MLCGLLNAYCGSGCFGVRTDVQVRVSSLLRLQRLGSVYFPGPLEETMKLTIVTAVAGFASSSANEVSPIANIIQMIGDLESKVISEGEECQNTYEDFSEWCEEKANN
jgi:chromosome condensin MukBEF MukE localization factor